MVGQAVPPASGADPLVLRCPPGTTARLLPNALQSAVSGTRRQQLKILLRNSPEARWQKLEPFQFGGPDGEKKLESLLEKSPDLLTTEGSKPILFFKIG